MKIFCRRQNVVTKVVIPRLKVTIKYILSELEEKEREETFRLKRFKQLKNKSNKDEAPIPCCCCKALIESDAYQITESTCPVCLKAAMAKAKNQPPPPKEVMPCEKGLNRAKETKSALDNLMSHIDNVIGLTQQYKSEGLVIPNLDRFVDTCNQVKSKIGNAAKSPLVCGVCPSPKSSQQTLKSKSSKSICPSSCPTTEEPSVQSVSCACSDMEEEEPEPEICKECGAPSKPEIDLNGPCSCTSLANKPSQTTCPPPPPPPPPPPQNPGEELGYFENEVKEIIKITRTQNRDGTISEEKEIISIKIEKKNPVAPTVVESVSCCSSAPSEDLCPACSGPRETKSESCCGSPQMGAPKVRSCISSSVTSSGPGGTTTSESSCCMSNKKPKKSTSDCCPPPESSPEQCCSPKPKPSNECCPSSGKSKSVSIHSCLSPPEKPSKGNMCEICGGELESLPSTVANSPAVSRGGSATTTNRGPNREPSKEPSRNCSKTSSGKKTAKAACNVDREDDKPAKPNVPQGCCNTEDGNKTKHACGSCSVRSCDEDTGCEDKGSKSKPVPHDCIKKKGAKDDKKDDKSEEVKKKPSGSCCTIKIIPKPKPGSETKEADRVIVVTDREFETIKNALHTAKSADKPKVASDNVRICKSCQSMGKARDSSKSKCSLSSQKSSKKSQSSLCASCQSKAESKKATKVCPSCGTIVHKPSQAESLQSNRIGSERACSKSYDSDDEDSDNCCATAQTAKHSASKSSCCSKKTSGNESCCSSDSEGKKDVGTITYRSGRYDVRPLQVRQTKERKGCCCLSEMDMMRSNHQHPLKRCRSLDYDAEYFFKW